MKYLTSLTVCLVFVFLALSSRVFAGSDEMNCPREFKEWILKSQCIFVGKMTLKNHEFLTMEGKLVPDVDGKILNGYLTDKYESKVKMPSFVRKWALLEPNKEVVGIVGKTALFKSFMTETWSEPALASCPHRSNCLEGQQRIWILVMDDPFKNPSWLSMSVAHLIEMKKILSTKKK